MVLLLWGGAFGVDLGLTVVSGRQVQNIADTAALDMARYINVADWNSISVRSLAESTNYLNGKLPYADTDNNSGATLTETPGVWLNGSFTPEGQKIGVNPIQCWYYTPPASHPCNAVKVTATQSVPQIFVGGHSTVTRSSIASVTPESGFSIGSYLASVNIQQKAVLNALLGTLGGPSNVTQLGFQGLANTNVTINQLITASGGLLTTSNVMTKPETGAAWQSIWSTAVANQVALLNCSSTPTPLACSASTALSGPTAMDLTPSTQVELCQLVSINGGSCSSGNLTNAVLATSLNALQTFTTEAEVANGTQAIDLGTSLGITGVSDAKLTLTMSQIPQVAFGPVGASASSAQMTTDLSLNYMGSVVDIPLSASLGTAALQTLSCAYNAMSATSIQPTTNTVTGTVTSPAGGGTLTLSGYNSGNTSPFSFGPSVVPLTYTTVNGSPGPPVIPVSNPLTPPALTPAFSYSGLTVPTSNPIYTLLTSTLPGVLGPILQVVGAPVGGVQVADLSTNCGAVSLVQ